MIRRVARAVSIAMLLLVACRAGEISKSRWNAMDRRGRVLAVESLRGHERALNRKGGGGRPHSGDTGSYVDRIDLAYRRGDQRSVNEIWETLSDANPPRTDGAR